MCRHSGGGSREIGFGHGGPSKARSCKTSFPTRVPKAVPSLLAGGLWPRCGARTRDGEAPRGRGQAGPSASCDVGFDPSQFPACQRQKTDLEALDARTKSDLEAAIKEVKAWEGPEAAVPRFRVVRCRNRRTGWTGMRTTRKASQVWSNFGPRPVSIVPRRIECIPAAARVLRQCVQVDGFAEDWETGLDPASHIQINCP